MKEHKKLYQKQVSKVTLHFVWGHLTRKQTVREMMQFGGILVHVNIFVNVIFTPVTGEAV